MELSISEVNSPFKTEAGGLKKTLIEYGKETLRPLKFSARA